VGNADFMHEYLRQLLSYVQNVPSEEHSCSSGHCFARQRRKLVEGLRGKKEKNKEDEDWK
jgi:hypothetical protein